MFARRSWVVAMLSVLLTFAAAQSDAQAAEDPGGTAGYDGGFFIRSGDGRFETKIRTRVQARYALEIPDEGDEASAFSIPRARLALGGHAFAKELTWYFQVDFAKGSVLMRDYYVNYAVSPEWLQLRAGQWKRPFSRQQITSSSKMVFIERAGTDEAFGAGRDIGFAIHNGYEKSPTFEYALGLFNGTGDKGLLSGDVSVDPATGEGVIESGKFDNVPVTFHPAAVLRLGYNHGGIKGYSEGDPEGGPLRFAIGASALADFDADGDDESGIRAELDYIVKAHGFATSGGVYLAYDQDGADFADQSYSRWGLHAQAGYTFGGIFIPSVRYGLVSEDGDDNDEHEVAVDLTALFEGHKLKWQAEFWVRMAEEPGEDIRDYGVTTQLQLGF